MTPTAVFRRLTFGIFTGVLSVALCLSNAQAMHAQVQCQACHVLRSDAKEGVARDLRAPRSAICLTCHDAGQDLSSLNPPYVINGSKMLAGGSFSATLTSDDTGHNMLSVDGDLGLTPPGGLPLIEFDCLSCHDPHTNGNYRNLKTEINGRDTVIIAKGDPGFQKNLYISGINNFCGACHDKFADGPATGSGGAWRRHPVGISIYGSPHANFDHWVRLKERITLIEFPTGTTGDPSSAQVFCLSCHVAHASPYRDALRWDYARTPEGCLECHAF